MTNDHLGHHDQDGTSVLVQVVGDAFERAPQPAELPKLDGDFSTLSDERGVWACSRSVKDKTVVLSRRPAGGHRQMHRTDGRPVVVIETTSRGGVKVCQFAYVKNTLCCLVSERSAASSVVNTRLILNASDGQRQGHGIVIEHADIQSPYSSVQMDEFGKVVAGNAKRAKVRARRSASACVKN